VCYHDCDFPLIVKIEETNTEIIWREYYNCQANLDRSMYPVFRFDKQQYNAALAELKAMIEDRRMN